MQEAGFVRGWVSHQAVVRQYTWAGVTGPVLVNVFVRNVTVRWLWRSGGRRDARPADWLYEGGTSSDFHQWLICILCSANCVQVADAMHAALWGLALRTYAHVPVQPSMQKSAAPL